MQNFDDLKNLWGKVNTERDLPSAKEILFQAKKGRKKMMRRNFFVIISLSFTFAYITWIGCTYDFKLWTTMAGIIIALISIMLGVIFSSKLLQLLLKQSDPTLDNKSYLQQLIIYRNKQRTIQSKGTSLYFVLLTIGMFLYMYEFAYRDLRFGFIIYSITITWVAFSWFYLRKRTIKKQEKEINTQISNIENLISSMENMEE